MIIVLDFSIEIKSQKHYVDSKWLPPRFVGFLFVVVFSKQNSVMAQKMKVREVD